MARGTHGSIGKTGKVKAHTPTVEPTEKRKKATGRAGKRKLCNKRFVAEVNGQAPTDHWAN